MGEDAREQQPLMFCCRVRKKRKIGREEFTSLIVLISS